MKVTVACIVAVILLSIPCTAQPPVGYAGLYSGEDHSYWCVEGVGFYPVEMWMFCLPSHLGQMCAEYDIHYPPNVITSTVTWNDEIISIILALPGEGISVCFISCQWDWIWISHQLLYVTDTVQTYCEIVPYPDTGEYVFANCEPGYPIEPFIKLTNFYINYSPADPECQAMDTESASWGAIKTLVR